MSPGLNYGLQVFEGMRAYRTPENRIALFRPRKNCARMQEGASFLGIPPVPEDLFLQAIHLVVGANAAFVPPHTSTAGLYIRPVVFGSGPQISLTIPQQFTFCVFVTPTGAYHGNHPQKALILEDLDRAAPRGTGHIKVGGNYAPVFRFSADARAQGYQITLHLDSSTHSEIDEFTTSGFIGIKKERSGTSEAGVTLVVPDSPSVLKSVTSESVRQLAASFGWDVQQRRISFEELGTFDEVVAAGTAATLVSIRSITMNSRKAKFEYEHESQTRNGNEEAELAVKRLLRTLRGIQRGEIKDQFGWLDYVAEPLELAEHLATGQNGINGAPSNEGVNLLP